jgi:hypothetical protein
MSALLETGIGANPFILILKPANQFVHCALLISYTARLCGGLQWARANHVTAPTG